MNRGVQDGKKRLALPDYLGVGDPANDGKLLQLDSTQPGGVKVLPLGTFADKSSVGIAAALGYFHVKAYGAKQDRIAISDAAMTSGQSTLACATSLPFTSAAVDVGKIVLVRGAGVAGADLVTTISGFTDTGHVSLAAAAGSAVSASYAVFGTEDGPAWQAAHNAWAASPGGGVITWDDGQTSLTNQALQQGGANKANSQIVIPLIAGAPTQQVKILRYSSMRGLSAGWENYGSSALLSPAIESILQGAIYSGTYGVPSVVGGPTQEQIASAPTFSNCIIEGDLWVRVPSNPSLVGINLEKCASAWLGGISIDTGGGAQPTRIQTAGIIMPGLDNYTTNHIDKLYVGGCYAGLIPGEHLTVTHLDIVGCIVPIGSRQSWLHPIKINMGQIANCPYVLAGWDPVSAGVGEFPALTAGGTTEIDLSVENSASNPAWQQVVQGVNDSNNNLRGRFLYTYFLDGVLTSLPLNGASDLIVVRKDLRGVLAVKNSVAQSVASATWTVLTFDTNNFDPDARHSTSTNTSRFNFLEPGDYVISASLAFAANATGQRGLQMRFNGSSLVTEDSRPATASGETPLTVTLYIRAGNPTDYVEFLAYQDSGAGLNVNADSSYSPLIRLSRLR